MSIFGFIADIFTPASKIIDRVVTTEKDRLELQNALAKINADVIAKVAELDGKVIELQGQLAQANARVAVAETQSESAFVRNYRPAIIVMMFLMICLESFGFLKMELPEVFWQIFAGAFGVMTAAPTVATGAVKVVEAVKNALGGKK